jgi:hypothetical protein
VIEFFLGYVVGRSSSSGPSRPSRPPTEAERRASREFWEGAYKVGLLLFVLGWAVFLFGGGFAQTLRVMGIEPSAEECAARQGRMPWTAIVEGLTGAGCARR